MSGILPGVLIKFSCIVHMKEHQETLMYVTSGFIAALNEVGLWSGLALMGIKIPRLILISDNFW